VTHASVVDEQIDCKTASAQFTNEGANAFRGSEIRGQGEDVRTTAQLLGERSQPVRSPSDEDERHPPPPQSAGKLEADPAAGSGDEGAAHHALVYVSQPARASSPRPRSEGAVTVRTGRPAMRLWGERQLSAIATCWTQFTVQ
jgi:hypothetical protein